MVTQNCMLHAILASSSFTTTLGLGDPFGRAFPFRRLRFTGNAVWSTMARIAARTVGLIGGLGAGRWSCRMRAARRLRTLRFATVRRSADGLCRREREWRKLVRLLLAAAFEGDADGLGRRYRRRVGVQGGRCADLGFGCLAA